jgi:phosphotriesterase-related protein
MASNGVWVELDGLGPGSSDRYRRLLMYLKDNKLLSKVLLSHDAGWYHVGEAGGGTFNDFNFMFEEFVPALRQAGFSEEEIDTVIRVNPMNAFAIRVRKQ